jgi:hypothetical protein
LASFFDNFARVILSATSPVGRTSFALGSRNEDSSFNLLAPSFGLAAQLLCASGFIASELMLF